MAELKRAVEDGAGAPRRRAGHSRGRGVRGRQPVAPDAPELHLAYPLQRRRGAEVDGDVRGSGCRWCSSPRRRRAPRSASAPSRATSARPASGARSTRRGEAPSRDPEFRSLPRPTGEARALADYHDPATLRDRRRAARRGRLEGDRRRARAPSRPPRGSPSSRGREAGLRRIGLILGGDVTILQESHGHRLHPHAPARRPTSRRCMTSFVTAMVEAREAKGSGWSTCTRLDHFTDEAGSEAARQRDRRHRRPSGCRRGTTRSSSAASRWPTS